MTVFVRLSREVLEKLDQVSEKCRISSHQLYKMGFELFLVDPENKEPDLLKRVELPPEMLDVISDVAQAFRAGMKADEEAASAKNSA